jgi:hypothetical protein
MIGQTAVYSRVISHGVYQISYFETDYEIY